MSPVDLLFVQDVDEFLNVQQANVTNVYRKPHRDFHNCRMQDGWD